MSVLRVTRAVYDSIRTHGEETYPSECCGALLGSPLAEGWQVVASVRAGNTRTDSAHNRYNIAPGELVRIERQARGQGLEIAGFYHSHPDHPARPSEFDREHAWPWYTYIVLSVDASGSGAIGAFELDDDTLRFRPVPYGEPPSVPTPNEAVSESS